MTAACYKSSVLCVTGDLVEDVIARALAPSVRDTDNPARVARVRGGSAANVAAAAAVLGGRVRFVGCVGADEVGVRLVAALAGDGVDVRVQHGTRTGTIVIVVEPDGSRTMYPDRGAAAELGPIDAGWADGVAWLHLTAYSLGDAGGRAAVTDFAGLVAAGGGRVSVDVSSVGLIEAVGAPSILEGIAALRPAAVFATADEIAALGCAPAGTTVVVKDGPRPVTVLHAAGGRDEVAVPSVADVIDTTGAGDAFAAGYIVAAMAGAAPVPAVGAAIAAAARTLSMEGARLGPAPPA